jgi:hypothetical protein
MAAPCPFAPLLARLDHTPRVVLRGAAPVSLARWPSGSPADLVWLGEPSAWQEADLHARWIAWPREAPLPPRLADRLGSHALIPLGAYILARRPPAAALTAEEAIALQARAAQLPPAEARALLRLLATTHAPARAALTERLMAEDAWADALTLGAGGAATGALTAFNQAIASGDIAAAERLAAALADHQPHNAAVLEAAMACSRQLGQAPRARSFARALLAIDPCHVGANLLRLEQAEAEGDPAAELAARSALAMAPAGALHPLRRLHEAHRAISLHLLRPLDAAGRAGVQALVAAARTVEPMELPEGEARHWARHYRHLSEAADAMLLGRDAPLLPVTRLHRAEGAPLGWAGLRRRAREARLAFVVAADPAYLRLYGRAYLASILRNADLPCVILVHVIGGAGKLRELIRLMDMPDPRIFYSADDFAPAAVTTQCHDSDGPRAQPVAHFQCTRFAMARRVLEELRLPLLVSDIDAVLQRGVGELLARFSGCDVVLNRNEASTAFGSHITANLLLAWPTPAARDWFTGLQGYLEAALAAPHVTRWIDQCGLQACWNASDARFGWFDTTADINNVMYPRWQPNPFLFLSLFHGFDMASLPAAG